MRVADLFEHHRIDIHGEGWIRYGENAIPVVRIGPHLRWRGPRRYDLGWQAVKPEAEK